MKVERKRLTQAGVGKIKVPETGRAVVRDAQQAGLLVEVTPSGVRSFYWYGRAGGRPRRIRLGRWPDLPLPAARTEAKKLAGRVATGEDPAADRDAARGEPTLGELWQAYLDGHAKPSKRSWREDERQWTAYLKRWGANRPLSSIDRPAVQRLHAKLGRGGTHHKANRALALLSSMFSYAVDRMGWRGTNPCLGVKRFPEPARERFLSEAELARFMEALKDEPERWQAYWSLSLCTGARRRNLMRMRWESLDVADPRGGLWRIPAEEAKAKRPMVVLLSAEAVAVLQWWRVRAGDSPWVFPSGRAEGPIRDPMPSWRRVCGRADIDGARPHDMRRTMASWAAGTGASLPVIGGLLGHLDASTTAIYARLDQRPQRAALEAATAAMLGAAGLPMLDVAASPMPHGGRTKPDD